MDDGTPAGREGRGLFDGFDAYRTPDGADFAAVLKGGLVVPDANVLLDLYRYTEQARNDLMGALRAVGERLWAPHHVVTEFWRNRETVIGDARAISGGAAEEMAGHSAAAVRTLRRWADRVALGEEEFAGLQARLAGVFDEVRARVTEVGESERRRITHDTGQDPVVAGLDGLLAGRVGAGFAAGEVAGLAAAGRERLAARMPPGYMDAEKAGDGALGDFFVWEQILRAAAEGGSDVLFVTADAKEDWWRRELGVNRGPRPELAAELRGRGGGRLFMLSPRRFLEAAALVLRLDLRAGSVEDIARVERIAQGPSYGGWTAAAIEALFQRLTHEGYGDRVAVIRHAAEADGRVDALSVCAICGYDDERGLRGFTTPVGLISARLREQGVIPDSAVPVLTAEYEYGHEYRGSQAPGEAQGYGGSQAPVEARAQPQAQAQPRLQGYAFGTVPGRPSGFRVHPLVVPLVVPLVNDAADGGE